MYLYTSSVNDNNNCFIVFLQLALLTGKTVKALSKLYKNDANGAIDLY